VRPDGRRGLCCFDHQLFVSAVAADRARDLLRVLLAGDIAWSTIDQSEPERADAARREIEALGRRVMWCAFLVLTGPIGLWLAWRCFRALRAAGYRPLGHAAVRMAAATCAVWTLVHASIAAHGELEWFGFLVY
jgi:hypothetical protein